VLFDLTGSFAIPAMAALLLPVPDSFLFIIAFITSAETPLDFKSISASVERSKAHFDRAIFVRIISSPSPALCRSIMLLLVSASLLAEAVGFAAGLAVVLV